MMIVGTTWNVAIASPDEIQVVSGGRTDYSTSYQATWKWKSGWLENGWVYYDPESNDNYEFEWELTLSVANANWGANDLALSTLNSIHSLQWYTADYYSVAQFDTTW